MSSAKYFRIGSIIESSRMTLAIGSRPNASRSNPDQTVTGFGTRAGAGVRIR